jgi:hypothetical protein
MTDLNVFTASIGMQAPPEAAASSLINDYGPPTNRRQSIG